MSGVNLAIFQGRLGNDAEVKETAGGKTVTKFSVCNTRRFTVGGERREDSTWVRVTAWNGVASGISDYLVKGKEVTVVGSLQTSQWEDADGNKRSSTEINAREIHLGADPRGGGEEDEAPARTAPRPPARKTQSKGSFAEYEDEAGVESATTEDAPW